MSYILTKDREKLSQLALTGVTEESLQLIHENQELLQSLVIPIVDELYDKIYRIKNFQKIIDKYTTLEKLKVTQHKYLREVFSPIISNQYIKNRYNIGKTHSRVGLDLQWFISTSQQYTQIIANYLMELLPASKAFQLSNAINSIFNFDMQITVAAYNEIEVDKAESPIRYEFQEMQTKTGLTSEDFHTISLYSGHLTFRLEEVLKKYEMYLCERAEALHFDLKQIFQLIQYLRRFLRQFLQEKMYVDEAAFYRIIRDWVGVSVKNGISEHKVTALVDLFNEVLRETFIMKSKVYEKEYLLFLSSFERLSRFALAIMSQLMIPYRSLANYHFLNIYSYEIDKINFGKITWIDENTITMLSSRGYEEQEIVGKRCFELFYNRVFPCKGCPVRNHGHEAFLTTYEQGAKSTYYKTWELPQSKMGGISHSLVISQDVTEESRVIFDTIESLLELAELRDDMTGKHVDRIGLLSSKLAQLAGYDEKFISNIGLAAKFHDVGKVGIPDSILNKPGKLTAEEWDSMKTHPSIGQQILSKLDLPVIQMAAGIAATHHEKWNGKGYPNGLKGEEIPVEGRIVAIVDVFDALLTKRAYKDAFPIEKVKEIMLEGRGSHFDPDLLDFFFSMWDEFIEIHQSLQEDTANLI